ncbi:MULTISPECIES: YeeE/YedE family protein [unclassified Paracoccus (in: a-proteobacteria)]|uniref:YeeE/YedE family protein n=1 Tax=unclassified Paracoccus (in: a-proteobacteria) TaxID=2688777 RepID=UPI0021E16CDF|nr:MULTISPECIES: YeeE/YedE family protein [unclassified Paracoccus (in: a-proteobacteria)]UXU76329.1 YeeE/YedE family protein [Paracoccus sp. SMMA_5]UXU82333.1 YeeE/YedE family protein [Paracoccus sp. SMMA_5_TC]
MDLAVMTDALGDLPSAALLGLFVGVLFGAAAQRSAFCLRAATVEFARGQLGPRLAVWLLAFSSALIWVQALRLGGLLDTGTARMMAVTGSLSGAIIGGLIFGAGMVLARGCPGRLLVLAATGNLRSILSGLVFAVTAQMALHGWLAAPRAYLAGMWTTPQGHNIELASWLGLPSWAALAAGLACAVLALALAWRNRISAGILIFGAGVGVTVAIAYLLTYRLSQIAFEPVAVTAVTFTGPSANTLMAMLVPFDGWRFDLGLVPGVFLGSFMAAWIGGVLRFQSFESPAQTRRALVGAVMMGFGGMLAGGCSIGNGLSGSAVMAATAWLALLCMWLGGMLTDLLLDRGGSG